MTDRSLDAWLSTRRREVERELDRLLAPRRDRPASLTRAMRYAVLGPGKRLRPVLALAAAEAVGGAAARRRALRPGCAIEMIHAYSLAHDDLPAMDDDDMRRGKPSLHVRFGEALAILTGDALLTDAFDALAHVSSNGSSGSRGPARSLDILAEVARAAGGVGMVAGQVLDLANEGRRGVSLSTVRAIHSRKTGALLRACVRAGAIAGGASAPQLARLSTYGESFGLVFQITDDILDEVGSLAALGKPSGGDRERGKATYPALLGLEGARREAQRAARRGVAALAPFGERAAPLEALLRRVLSRAS